MIKICLIFQKRKQEISRNGLLLNFSFGGRIRIAALVQTGAEKWIDRVVTVGGWVKTLREGGGGSIAFIELNDGSTIKGLQIVVEKTHKDFESAIKEGIGSSMQIRGLVVKSPGTKQPVSS
jgi:asparaginyl-tRNA synthetase